LPTLSICLYHAVEREVIAGVRRGWGRYLSRSRFQLEYKGTSRKAPPHANKRRMGYKHELPSHPSNPRRKRKKAFRRNMREAARGILRQSSFIPILPPPTPIHIKITTSKDERNVKNAPQSQTRSTLETLSLSCHLGGQRQRCPSLQEEGGTSVRPS
jgi:hypothetical protein